MSDYNCVRGNYYFTLKVNFSITINHEFTYVTFQRFELFKKNDYKYRITNPWMNTTGTAKGDDDIPETKEC